MTTTNGSFSIPLLGTLLSNATDIFKLTAAAAGAVKFSFVHPAGAGTGGSAFRLQLVDALGNVLVDTTANGNLTFDTTVTAGEYSLKVIDPSNNSSGPGAYSVTAALSGQAGTTYDGGANNTTAGAIIASLGMPIVGSLMANDVDVFKIAAAAGGVVTLDFVHPEGAGTSGNEIAIELLDGAGNVVTKTTVTGNAKLATTVASTGTYFIKVSDGASWQAGDGGLYTLTPSVSTIAATTYDGGANNTAATAIASALGRTIVGSLNSNDVDVFALRADSGGVVTLDFIHPEGAGKGGNDIAIELSDAAGNVVFKIVVTGNSVLSTTVAGAGDYFVKVSDGASWQSGDGGIYKLTPTLATAVLTTYDGAANNTSATAIASSFGTTIAGSLNENDVDMFKVQAKSGGVVRLDFTHPEGVGTTGKQIAIELLDAAGNSVIKSTVGGNTVLATTVAAAGDYFVKVSDGATWQYGDGGIYKLATAFIALDGVVYDGAANNSSATAVKTALPGAMVGSLNNADSDYFSFSSVAGGPLSISLNHPNGAGSSGAGITLTLLDAKANTVVTKTVHGNELFTANLPAAGDYSLKVADSATYNLADGGIYTIMAGMAGNGGSTQNGTPMSDRLAGTSSNDVIDGAGGVDTVTYLGNAANYRIAISAAGVSVIDLSGKDGADTLFNVERLQFADQMVSLDVGGVAAQAYRVYQAAFDRAPDAAGLGYWIANMEKGATLASVAQAFIGSKEFRDAYGAQPANRDMVSKFYTNVLHRAPDSAGLDFWVKALDSGAVDPAAVLAGFSESTENVAQLIGTISHGIGYLPYA